MGLFTDARVSPPHYEMTELLGVVPGYQHSLRLMGNCTARPPSAVSLYLWFISSAVSHIVFTTASREMRAFSGLLCRASWEAVIAFIAPIVLRSMQGTCTSPPTGSQVRP